MGLSFSDVSLHVVPGKGGYVITCRGIDLLLSAPFSQGIPDVAAQSDSYRIFLSGVPRLIGGTSASSPAFAGIVALLNDARLSKKQPPLGFLNPLLYSKGLSGFNDITIGHNSGCGTTGFKVRCRLLYGV
jgi:tripeptidyl-peptidase-1